MPEIVEVDITYAVFYRHFSMSGGIFNYGFAQIVDFFPTFQKADECAKKTFAEWEGEPDLHVWVMRCLKTYNNGGIAIERGGDELCKA